MQERGLVCINYRKTLLAACMVQTIQRICTCLLVNGVVLEVLNLNPGNVLQTDLVLTLGKSSSLGVKGIIPSTKGVTQET
jgi:hypothetical protein